MSLPWSEKTVKATPVGADEVLLIDSEDTNPETLNKRARLDTIPSAGQTNTASNVGTGEGVFKQKTGVDLEFKSLIGQTDKIILTGNTNDITFTLGTDVVTIDQANAYDAGFKQSFVANATTAGININTQVPSTLAIGDIWRTATTIQYQDTTATTRTILVTDLAQTLTNKIIDADNNTIFNLALGFEVTGSSTDLNDSANLARLDTLNDFTAGTESLFFRTESSSPSTTGIFRLANVDDIGWRNNINNADLLLEVTTSDFLTFNSSFIAATASQGTTGQIITSNGSGSAPTFEDPATSGTVSIVRLEGSDISTNRQALNFLDTTNNIDFLVTDDLGNNEAEISANISTSYPGQTSLTTLGTITTGTWNANTITVPFGGTGSITLTDGGILFGSGTGAITATSALANGEIVIGDGTTTPTTLDVGSSSAITILGTVTTGIWNANTITVPFGGTGDTSFTANGVIFGNNTGAFGVTATGSSGEILTSNGGGSPPTFQSSASVVFPVSDSTSIIEGSADSSKLLRFEIDGFTTGTTRVITPPDADIQLVNTSNGFITNSNLTAGTFTNITGVGVQTQTLDMGTQAITNAIIDAANNTISNIGNTEVISSLITGQTQKLTPVEADQVLISDSEDSDNLKRTIISTLPVQSNVEAYDEARTYKIGDIVRLLDAENFIATTTPTVGPFLVAEWEPVRQDIETGIITSKVTNVIPIDSITGDGVSTTVDVVLDSTGDYQAGDFIFVRETTNFNELLPVIVLASPAPTATTFSYTASVIRPNVTETVGIIVNLSRINVGPTQGFIVDNSDATHTTATPIDEPITIGFTYTADAEQMQILMDDLGAIFVKAFLPNADVRDRVDNLALGASQNVVAPPVQLIVVAADFVDPMYQRGMSNRNELRLSGGKIYPGGILAEGASNLTINISGGQFFSMGLHFDENINIPDTLLLSDQFPVVLTAFASVFSDGDTLADAVIDTTSNEIDVDNFNPNNQKLAIPVSNTAIIGFDITDGGTDFVDGEGVTITGVTSGANDAMGTLIVDGGAITGIVITDSGSGYIDGENLNLTGSGTGEVLTVQISGDKQFQIFRVYLGGDTTFVYYGQKLYTTVEEAQSLLDTDTFQEKFLTIPTAFRGFIIAKSGISEWVEAEEGENWLFIPKPEEYSIDRGNPQNRTLGQTQQQLQATLANQSTGVIDDGTIVQTSRSIVDIVDNGADITVNTTVDHDFQVADRVEISGATASNGTFTIAIIDDSDTFTTVAGGGGGNGTGGTALNLNRIDIEAGDGVIMDHSTPGDFIETNVQWNEELGQGIGAVTAPIITDSDNTFGANYILKDSLGATLAIPKDDTILTQKQVRQQILLGITFEKKNQTPPADTDIFTVVNQKIIVAAPRSITDDYNNLLRRKSGSRFTQVAPATDFQVAVNAGEIVGRGINSDVDMENPNIVTVAAASPVAFYLVSTNGFETSTTQEDPDNTMFDNAGVISSVAMAESTVQRLWCEPISGTFFLQYGTEVFTNAEIGNKAFRNEEPDTPPGLSTLAFVVASLIMRGGDTNWNASANNELDTGDITGSGSVVS